MNRPPDVEGGRFFISPLLGCKARCHFCYIYNKGYTAKVYENTYSISDTISYLENHSEFTAGECGSIISIGAWGDPFPSHSFSACQFTLKWLSELAKLKNPIQIMSRYELSQKVMASIANENSYKGHIMYSTSISSIANYKKIEPHADSPGQRLKSLQTLQGLGVSTNVMIKPFISGVTDLDVIDISKALENHGVEHCVVGGLLLDNRVKRILFSTGLEEAIGTQKKQTQVLDCTSGESYDLGAMDKISNFSNKLERRGIKVFKKSSCVNSYILNTPNPANYINHDPNGYCIKCGVCE